MQARTEGLCSSGYRCARTRGSRGWTRYEESIWARASDGHRRMNPSPVREAAYVFTSLLSMIFSCKMIYVVCTQWKIFERAYSAPFFQGDQYRFPRRTCGENKACVCTAPIAVFHARLLKDYHLYRAEIEIFFPLKMNPFNTKHHSSALDGVRLHGDWVISCQCY